MPFEPNRLLNLSIDWRSKGLPYPAEGPPDGSHNYGYRQLKGYPDRTLDISEAQNAPLFAAALGRLNTWDTAFFTTGCEKCDNERRGEARPIGYIEFCFNAIAQAKDPSAYFQVYHALSQLMLRENYEASAGFLWNLSRTNFLERGDSGYSAAVFVQSFDYGPRAEALQSWQDAVDYLVTFLCSWPAGSPPNFYEPPHLSTGGRASSRPG